ncbi:MAG TPA: hypothetical protein VHZ73_12535 [Vicinamibacterales bacterium]|jgi:signal transduction histidine kinase|nr:hypothetical protein [Vicinamibacterales bacterium]
MAPDVALAASVALVAVAALLVRELAHRRERARLQGEIALAQAKLSERSGLAAVGEMVSGLAQELKAPLQEVLGNTELMLATTLGNSGVAAQAAEDLQHIRNGAARAAAVVRHLVAATETVSLSRRWHDINDIIDGAAAASRHDLDANGARLERRPAERLPMVYIDGRQLEKAFALLIARPAHGRPQRGRAITVTISVTRVMAPDDHVMVTIADDGRPVEGEEHGAAGFGAVRHLVEAHGGALITTPAGADAGTRVTIEIPIAAARATERSHQEMRRPWNESSTSSTSTARSTSRS